MKSKIHTCSAVIWLGAGLMVWLVNPGLSFGQGGIPIPTPTPTPVPATPLPQQQPQTGAGQQQTSGGRQTAQTSDGGVVDIDPSQAVQFADFPDTRNQGFVGATSDRMGERGFVGAPSQFMGTPAENSTFGGGQNTTAGTGTSGGGGRGQTGFGGQGIGQGGGLGNFGQGAGNQNSFVVQRGGLRGAVTPNFTSSVTTGNQISKRFSTNFSNLPQSQFFGGQYQVVVNNKKATLSGWVNSKADSDHLMAQLRFQPGIYEIENKLEIREE